MITPAPYSRSNSNPFNCLQRIATRVLGVVAMFIALAACSDNKPSQIDSALLNPPDSITQQLGENLGVTQPKPAHSQRFRVSAGAQEYADAGLLIELKGSIELGQTSQIVRHQWVQIDGPEAQILAPEQLTTGVILPQAPENDRVTFALQAADDQGYVAQSQIRITLLPLDNPWFGAITQQIQDDEQLRIRITRDQGQTIQYRTADGTALAGRDYQAQSGELTFDGETFEDEITIPLLPGAQAPGNRYLLLHLQSNGEAIEYRRLYIAIYGAPVDSEKPGNGSSSSSSSSSSSGSSSSSSSSSSTSSSSSSSSSSGNASSSSSGAPIAVPCSPNGGNLPSCRQLQTDGNPYLNTQLYLDPDYRRHLDAAQAESADQPELVAAIEVIKQQPTAIWLDSIAMLEQGDPTTGRRSLRWHLQNATAQQAAATSEGELLPMTVQVVLALLPLWQPDADATPEQVLEVYKTQFIAPLKQLVESFPNLRVVAVVEPNALPQLASPCESQCLSAETIQLHLEHILTAFADNSADNFYAYLGIGHSAWLTLSNAAERIAVWLANFTTQSLHPVRGLATNTAAYTPTEEPFMLAPGNTPLHRDRFYKDELSLISQIHTELEKRQLGQRFGFIIDTSRNGWGGINRPTLMGNSDTSGLDRRSSRSHWCNVAAAGIGARQQIQPDSLRPYIDAYTWLKQPGYSDGDDTEITMSEGPNPHPVIPACAPENGAALANPPPGGHWFHTHFINLIHNAWPPLLEGDTTPTAEMITLEYRLDSAYTHGTENVSLYGKIADGAEIASIEVFINGLAIEEPLEPLIRATEFTIPVTQLPLPQAAPAPTEVITEKAYSVIRVRALDTSGMVSEGTVTYSIATDHHSLGTDSNDLVLYHHTQFRALHRNYGGDNLILPLTNESSPVEILVGDGDDRILLTAGRLFSAGGNNTIEILPGPKPCDCRASGGPGSDLYIVHPSNASMGSITLVEDTEDTTSLDRLLVRQYPATEIQFSTNINRTHLILTLPNRTIITIQDYFDLEQGNNNTIEEIEFAEGEIWTFDDFYQLVFD